MWNSQIVILDLGVSLSVREISKLTEDCWRIADKNMNHILILKCNPNYKREPRDVAIVDESTAAFSTWNSQIVIRDLGYRSQLSVREISKTKGDVWGITAYNKNLILALICDL